MDKCDLGVLLVNLGTPDAPTTKAIRRYLKEFLSDPRVIDLQPLLWQILLRTVILPFRPRKIVQQYKEVWQQQGSPLRAISEQQAEKLAKHLQQQLAKDIPVIVGMTYGNPSLKESFDKLNAKQVVVLPLFPQYSATTTAAVFDAIAKVFKKKPLLPSIRMINEYHDNPKYIDTLANHIEHYWQQSRGQRLLMSFHGIPERYYQNGDPYPEQCLTTATLLAERLQLKPEQWLASFQSRFGPAKWVQPYTSDTLEQWGKQGLQSVDVISPGFPTDCLETLEELQVENADIFKQAGGGEFRYIPALNDQDYHIELLSSLVIDESKGWI